jgi:hypothetical protein
VDFTGAWRAARQLPRPPRAGEMDAVLHRERTGRLRQKVTHLAPAGELPDGVMVRVGGGAALLLGGRLLPWSFHGFGAPAGPGRRVRWRCGAAVDPSPRSRPVTGRWYTRPR